MGLNLKKRRRRPASIGHPMGKRQGKVRPVSNLETPMSEPALPSTATIGPDVGAALTLKPRTHLGYTTERAAYQSRKADLLRSDPGTFVVFVGEAMAGPFADFRSAYREGLRRFGQGPLYIKQVLAEEPAAESGASEPCRS